MQYQITITTAYPKDYAALFSMVVNSGYKARIEAGPIDSDTPDPVLPSASADVAPAEELANKEQISELASLVIPPGLPEELSKSQPSKVKNLEEFLQRFCCVDASCHTVGQEILMALASVIEDKSRLLDYLRDDGKPNKTFKVSFNAWKKERNIIQNGQKEVWLGTRSAMQTTYPIRISLGG